MAKLRNNIHLWPLLSSKNNYFFKILKCDITKIEKMDKTAFRPSGKYPDEMEFSM